MNVNDALWSILEFPFGPYHLPRRSTLMGLPTEYTVHYLYHYYYYLYNYFGGGFTFSIYLDLTLELKVNFPTPLIKDKTKSTVGLHTVTGR